MEELLLSARYVDSDPELSFGTERDQDAAERPGILVTESGEDQTAFLPLDLGDECLGVIWQGMSLSRFGLSGSA